jgi:hyaluronan synthase/N-acetylglucosaminyltransferase
MSIIHLIYGVLLTSALVSLTRLVAQIILAELYHSRHTRGERSSPAPAERPFTVSVIYPVYNESPQVLRIVLERARKCLSVPGVDFVFVDDGSPNRADLEPIYSEFSCPRIRILYQRNGGKRDAQYHALSITTGEFIITVDSDTLIEPEGIRQLVRPLLDEPTIGAACGDVRVENSNANLLTRMQDRRYWTAFNLERAAQSIFRAVLCCSGPFSVYRADVLQRIKEAYISQTFFGARCTYGDDRHLTNLVLGEGLKVVYEPGAIAWTFVPETLGDFIRQQNRWNKSFYREVLWTWRIADRIHPYALFETIIQPLLFVGSTISFSYVLFVVLQTLDWRVVLFFLETLVIAALMRAAYGLWRTRDLRFLIFVLYGFMHVFVLQPVRFKSLLTLSDNRWGTRVQKPVSQVRDFALWASGYLAVLLTGAGFFLACGVEPRVAPRVLPLNDVRSPVDFLECLAVTGVSLVSLIAVMVAFRWMAARRRRDASVDSVKLDEPYGRPDGFHFTGCAGVLGNGALQGLQSRAEPIELGRIENVTEHQPAAPRLANPVEVFCRAPVSVADDAPPERRMVSQCTIRGPLSIPEERGP